ncbi:MAG: hypothetical protein JW725_04995 [Candidatus Babeliaceae bacterium]|nr:hypothetical protein [Candidatus Babeliaceae bacterium]
MTEKRKNSKIGRASLFTGIAATIGWGVFLLGSVLAASIGATENTVFLTAIVVFAIGGFLMNILGFILGIIALAEKKAEKRNAIIGLFLNSAGGIVIMLVVLLDRLANS